MGDIRTILAELTELSVEFCARHDTPKPRSFDVPDDLAEELGLPLDPVVAAILGNGDLGTERAGVDLQYVEDWTWGARDQGLDEAFLVIGAHPDGHTWLTVDTRDEEVDGIVEIDRFDGSDRYIPLSTWLKGLVRELREDIEEERS